MTRKTFKKVIVTDELLSRVDSKNKTLVASFLKEKNTRVSDMTITGYRSDLNIFFVWNLLNNNNKFFIDIKKLEFADFFSFAVEELQWSAARFARCRATLSSFSQFIEKFYDDEYPDFRNVILKVIDSIPKTPVREKTILSEEDIYKLLNILEEKDIQQACWLALAFGSGARFSELLRFKTEHIDENRTAFDGIFLETTKQIKTKGRTKSGKLLYKYVIKNVFLPYYQAWIKKRKTILDENGIDDHGFIFIKKNGQPAEGGTVRSWINGMTKMMGVTVYPHAFRHAITTYLSQKGLPTQLIKELMGWSTIVMVELYDDTSVKDKDWKELSALK